MHVTTILSILTSVCAGSEVSTAIGFHRNDSKPGNSTADSPSIGGGIPIKDIRLQCDGTSLGLVASQERSGIYYLRGVCGSLYNDPHKSRCSFLDLSMCYINDGGNIRAQKMGNFLNSCANCTLYSANASNMLACTCARGDLLGGGTQEAAVQLDDLLFVKNGFLSCYGYTNFECPYDNVPY